MGFNPYQTIRRARMTRRGDIIYLVSFLVVLAALIAWAMA
jgi:hypothetical protein